MAGSKLDKPLDAVIKDILALNTLKEDRSIAIMAASILDYWLGRAILTRLVELTDDKEREAFFENGGSGPLSSMSRKIWIGYGLGLYKVEARKDLLAIKNIRNKFAHSDEHIDFTDQSITGLANSLFAPKYLAASSMKPEQTDPKERYLDSIHHLVSGFHLATKFHIHRPPAADTLQY